MAVTRTDLVELVDALEIDIESKSRLRDMILPPDTFSRIERTLETLAEAQLRSEGRLDHVDETLARLAAMQAETAAAQAETAAAQAETAVKMTELVAAQAETAVKMTELAASQARTDVILSEFAASQSEMMRDIRELQAGAVVANNHLGDLRGWRWEARYLENAPAYFGRILRKTRAMRPSGIIERLQEQLDDKAYREVIQTDVLVAGIPRDRPDLGEVWLAMEVSATVDRSDIERAVIRAGHLRAAGLRAIPAAGGGAVTEGGAESAADESVLLLTVGSMVNWDRALARLVASLDSA